MKIINGYSQEFVEHTINYYKSEIKDLVDVLQSARNALFKASLIDDVQEIDSILKKYDRPTVPIPEPYQPFKKKLKDFQTKY